MSFTNTLPSHLRPCREKLFGAARGIPLDRNAKARIIVYARAYNARYAAPASIAARSPAPSWRCWKRCCGASTTARTGVAFRATRALPRGPDATETRFTRRSRRSKRRTCSPGLIASCAYAPASSTCSANGPPAGASFAAAMPTCFAIPCPVPKADRLTDRLLSRKIPLEPLIQIFPLINRRPLTTSGHGSRPPKLALSPRKRPSGQTWARYDLAQHQCGARYARTFLHEGEEMICSSPPLRAPRALPTSGKLKRRRGSRRRAPLYVREPPYGGWAWRGKTEAGRPGLGKDSGDAQFSCDFHRTALTVYGYPVQCSHAISQHRAPGTVTPHRRRR